MFKTIGEEIVDVTDYTGTIPRSLQCIRIFVPPRFKIMKVPRQHAVETDQDIVQVIDLTRTRQRVRRGRAVIVPSRHQYIDVTDLRPMVDERPNDAEHCSVCSKALSASPGVWRHSPSPTVRTTMPRLLMILMTDSA